MRVVAVLAVVVEAEPRLWELVIVWAAASLQAWMQLWVGQKKMWRRKLVQMRGRSSCWCDQVGFVSKWAQQVWAWATEKLMTEQIDHHYCRSSPYTTKMPKCSQDPGEGLFFLGF